MHALPSPTRRSRLALALALACVAAALLAPATLAFASPGAGELIRVELRPFVEVSGTEVTLGDVAALTTGDLLTLRRLMALPLGRTPRAGAAVRVGRTELARWIRARAGIDPSRIAWSGPGASEVRAVAHALRGEVIAGRALDAVRVALTQRGLRVEPSLARVPQDVPVPPGQMSLDVRALPETAALARRLSVWVDVSVDGRFVRTVSVPLELRVFGPAYVATRDRAPGDALEPSSVEIREVEWSGRTAPPARPGSTALRARRPVAAGEPLTRAQVEAAPEVARGAAATLRARRGAVELESRVEILEDGFAGQSVHVRLPGASSAIAARVTGPGTVEVIP